MLALTVDPTFNLGDFECTPITYRHLLLTTRRYGTAPVFLGLILIHYRKNFQSFLSSLVGLRRPLEGIRVFGTDGEKALVDAFTHSRERILAQSLAFMTGFLNTKLRLLPPVC